MILQFIFLSVFFLIILAIIKPKWLTILLSILFSLFFTTELVYFITSNEFIDYKFWVHFNWREISNAYQGFGFQLVLFILLFIAIGIGLYKGGEWLRKTYKKLPKVKLYSALGILACTILMSIPNGIFQNLYSIYQVTQSKVLNFNESLEVLGISPDEYIYPDELNVQAGKNIIILSMESLEKSFIDAELTPNLVHLQDEFQFFPMQQSNGAGWTSGSLYTLQTGVPALFKNSGNEIFQSAYQSKLSSLGVVFNKAGYQQLFLNGNAKFSGTSDMLKTFQIPYLEPKYFEEKYGKLEEFGAHDYDLFDEAKEQLLKFREQQSPFVLYLSSISTHFPNGIYDSRFEEISKEKREGLPLAIHGVDYLIGDFIQFLKKENFLENTVFYIFPDHLFMGRNELIKLPKKDRELYVITNSKERPNDIENFAQVDLSKYILEAAGVANNMTHFSSFIEGNKNDFIKRNQSQITSLNESSLKVYSFEEGFTISRKINGDSYHYIFTNEKDDFRSSSLPVESPKVISYSFNDNFRSTGDRVENNIFEALVKSYDDQLNFILETTQDSTFVYYRKGSTLLSTFAASKDNNINIHKEHLALTPAIYEKVIAHSNATNKHLNVKAFYPLEEDMIFLKSSSWDAIKEHNYSQIHVGYKQLSPTRGINLLTRDENNIYQMTNYDTFESEQDARNLLAQIKNLLAQNKFFALVGSDSSSEKLSAISSELGALGFEKLKNLQSRTAYICYSDRGYFCESTDKLSISLTVSPDYQYKRSQTQIDKDAKDPSRFIAHAGGKVQNTTYTSSLEALNANYSKGFRYFELDIITTSDGKFVAEHDWEKWRKENNVMGQGAVSHQQFMSTKKLGKFTPLDMVKINEWFSRHSDAVLVTDKVNDPIAFASQFVAPQRLMMELFSEEALEKSKKAGLKMALVSENVLQNKTDEQIIEFYQKNQYKGLAISRKTIPRYVYLMPILKNMGVKTYVYHVNFEKHWSDEKYVFLSEMETVYGMYADEWSNF